jgi:hypothetical protein
MTTKINPKSDGFNAQVAKPNIDSEGKKLWFTCACCKYIHEGLWIDSEQMFFIGFENNGDFLFAFDVAYWGYMPESN